VPVHPFSNVAAPKPALLMPWASLASEPRKLAVAPSVFVACGGSNDGCDQDRGRVRIWWPLMRARAVGKACMGLFSLSFAPAVERALSGVGAGQC